MTQEPEPRVTAAERQLRHELAVLGYPYDDLSEMVRSGHRYEPAVPILTAALNTATDRRLQNSIIRALSVPWAASALPAIAERFWTIGGDPLGPRWALGNAIEVLWNDRCFDQLAAIADDARLGRSREMVVLGLTKSRHPRAEPLLVSLIDDPEVRGHAIQALRRRGHPFPTMARNGLERALTDSRRWVVREANRVLAFFDQ